MRPAAVQMEFTDAMSGVDAAAATAGAHALLWYVCLLALLLAGERLGWSDRARRQRERGRALRARTEVPGLSVRGIGVFIVAAACFAFIAYVTRGSAFAQADQAFLDAVQANLSATAIKQFKWITWFGDARSLALVCIGAMAVLFARGDRAWALGMLAAAGGNGLLNGAMKRIFDRSCPRHDMGPLLGHGLCFPSGHTSGAVVTYGMLAYILIRSLPRRWHLLVLTSTTTLVFTVGCSRVFIDAHFPSDVAAGFASGMAWLALVIACTEALQHGWRPGLRRHDPAQHAAPTR